MSVEAYFAHDGAKASLDCGGTTPLFFHVLLAPGALEFTPSLSAWLPCRKSGDMSPQSIAAILPPPRSVQGPPSFMIAISSPGRMAVLLGFFLGVTYLLPHLMSLRDKEIWWQPFPARKQPDSRAMPSRRHASREIAAKMWDTITLGEGWGGAGVRGTKFRPSNRPIYSSA